MKGYIWVQLLVILFLFDSKVGSAALAITTLCYLFVYKDNLLSKLLHCIVYTAPFYAFSFYGGRERLSLCTLYIIAFCICAFIMNIRKQRLAISSKHILSFVLSIFVTVGYLISLSFSIEPMQMLWDTYHSLLLIYALIACWLLDGKLLFDIEKEMGSVVQGICSIAVGVFIQYVLYQYANIELGSIYITGGTRYIFNLYFLPKSVLSMYLSIGLVYFYVNILRKTLAKDIVAFVLILGAMLLNNSRTGLACFIIAATMYTIVNFRNVTKRLRNVAILLLIVFAGMYVVDYYLSTRTVLSSVLDDNGRFEIISQILSILPQHLLGIGGAVVDYNAIGITVVPHIYLLQVILQCGIIGGISLLIILFSSFLATKTDYKYYILALICGSFLFANWQNAVFAIPIFLLAELENTMVKNKKL